MTLDGAFPVDMFLFQITLIHIKFYPKAPEIFLMLTVQQAIEISSPSDDVMSAETGITDHFLLQRILTYILRLIPLQIPEVFSR